MKPPPFDYLRAESIDQAIDLLADHGEDGKVVAGGQSLIPLLNLRLARPSVLIDVNDLTSLASFAVTDEALITGGLLRHRSLCENPAIAAANPLVSAAAKFIGHAAIRQRGTLGGSIAHADPSAELPMVAVACGATVLVESSTGEREIGAEDFFLGPFTTDLQPEELVLGVRWPVFATADRWGYSQVAERSGDFAEAAAAVTMLKGVTRVVVSGVPGSPLRLRAVEEWLRGTGDEPGAVREVARQALLDVLGDGPEEQHVRCMVEEMVVRAVAQALRDRRAA
ncbi:MAG TPA: FAD binding domain-containing protein [Actinomycetales bacterium]|nr:FAD binding domain-containing protein [Actinomycetales bacterium]